MGLRIGQILAESNAVDELHLEEAHYAAKVEHIGLWWLLCRAVIHGTFKES